jgi:aryl-alcohol dehydrogenase-like predicted oxidoreductase
MEYTSLGRTGLRVSRLGLGCGGHSRLGLSVGKSELDAEALVKEAIALGVNFIDTAEAYGTEEVVGSAIQSMPRDEVVISTKAGVNWHDHRCTTEQYLQRIDASLNRLRTDYVDIYHLHGVSLEDYRYAEENLLPALKQAQAAGKVRFIGITERFAVDPGHTMLVPALKDNHWDVVMVGFNILNQSARNTVLNETAPRNIGTLCMFAVRRALSKPEALRELMLDLASRGLIDSGAFDPLDPLGFLMNAGAESIPDAAYRFCRYEPGLDVILSGTSSADHLRQNAESLGRDPLSSEIIERLRSLFARVDCVSGN